MEAWEEGRGTYGARKISLAASYALLPLFCLFLGCAGPTTDRLAVEAVAAKRQQALNRKDIALYLSIISPAYNDKGKDYAAKARELEASFRTFDRIEYHSLDRKIEIGGAQATVSGTYRMTVVRRGKELSLEGVERIRLAKGADGWRIVGGL
jgi:hypothetical protein